MQGRHFHAGLVGVAIVATAIVGGIDIAQAQVPGPQAVITWTALNSYAPANYVGKVLPNQASEIVASLAVIDNGQFVNLSDQTIYWYQNDNLMGGGMGVQKFAFRPYGTAPNTITLKVEIPDYPSGLVIHEVNIPIVQPIAVISAPYPGGTFSANRATVQALPYFFATTSTSPLNFAWSVNGQTVTSAENPQSLQISLPGSTPAGYGVAVSLTISNSIDSMSAGGSANLTYQQQP